MTFGESISTCIAKLKLPIKGRASRSEFWWFMLFGFLAAIAFIAVVGGIFTAIGLSFDPANPDFGGIGAGGVIGVVLFFLLYIAAIFFFMIVSLGALAATVRRLHDRNMSGWWYVGYIVVSVIPFVNLVAFVALIVILCLKGTDGPNNYGPDPLGASDGDVFA